MARHVVTPSASRLTSSLRDVGYDFPAAVADIVDNAISAGAARVDISIEFAGSGTSVKIADDGTGMSINGLTEALRFGSRSRYHRDSLGRFGLGLKTASLSQARTLTVATRRRPHARPALRRLDLDLIAEWDDWLIIDPGRQDPTAEKARTLLDSGFSTVVCWDRLDRVLPETRPDGGWARRRIETLVEKTRQHLAIVFHRFLAPDTNANSVVLTVNGEKIHSWHPLAPDEPATTNLPELTFEAEIGDYAGHVRLERAILPSRSNFSSVDEFERLSGPMRWNRQQGLYFYRANRLVQWGGWSGLRAIDEHTKLARACLSFNPDLDELFRVNVSKMRVSLPSQLRNLIQDPLNELCSTASQVYRSSGHTATPRPDPVPNESREADSVSSDDANPEDVRRTTQNSDPSRHTERSPSRPDQDTEPTAISLALRSAALQTGDYEALRRISAVLSEIAPQVHAALRFRDL